MTYLYWRHKQTGALYAVRVADDGVIDGTAELLPSTEATAANLKQWSFDAKKGEELRRGLLEFERVWK